jgi:hypothetical protein
MRISLLLAICVAVTFSAAQGVGGGLPIPPPSATVFNQIQQMSGWQWCNSPKCAGGSGNGTYWMAQFQQHPSISGASTQLYNSGIWDNALWYMKLGSGHDAATNLLWDFWVQVDSNAAKGAQALEYDSFQFVNGYNYMIGSQCNVAAGLWDVWDELHGKWIHTTIPCHGFPANTWHHIQWYVTTNHSNNTYTYHTLVVDGMAHNLNLTYSAKNIGWYANIGVQYQLDVNATGQGYNEWFDLSKLTIW